MKNKGFTLTEIVVAMAIASLFIGFSFPILRSQMKISDRIIKKSKLEQKQRRVMNIIKKTIRDSGEITNNTVRVSSLNDYITRFRLVVKDSNKEGNLLYIETPYRKTPSKIQKYAVIFQFLKGKLLIHRGIVSKTDITIDTTVKNVDLERKIYGSFEKNSGGVFIKIGTDENLEKDVLIDYEKIPYKI